MTEGELKKRIMALVNSPLSIDDEYIQDILDEAAKEFPMTEQQIRILTDGPIKLHEVLDRKIVGPEEVARWFKKYFLGDSGVSIQVAGGCTGHIDMDKLQDIEKE
jgi:inorganic pyrophosphatase/exopolyphosphatase